MGVGGDVEVLRGAADEDVPDGAADDVGVKPRASQALDHPYGVRIDKAHVDPVLRLGVDVSLLFYVAVSRCAVSEKQFCNPG